ncbi:MAG: hypothetical protein JXB15_13050 [Anaerolineales bacterium]|nr:hypothetical protein [Anaerolineales bacterium]
MHHRCNLHSRILNYALVTLVLAIIASGCGSPVETESPPTQTAQAERASRLATQMAGTLVPTWQVSNAEITATAQAFDGFLQEVRQWPLFILDTFDSDRDLWDTGVMTDTLGTAKWAISENIFQWDLYANQGVVWWSIPEIDSVGDFYVSVDVQQIDGPEDAQCGLVFRRTDDQNYYLFEINRQGQYAAYLYLNGSWETWLEWSEFDAIQTNEPNRLSVIGLGSTYWFLVNNQIIPSISGIAGNSQDGPVQGTIGLLVGLDEAGQSASWEFDNFEIRIPPADTPTP